jgi:hypothetical protein
MDFNGNLNKLKNHNDHPTKDIKFDKFFSNKENIGNLSKLLFKKMLETTSSESKYFNFYNILP